MPVLGGRSGRDTASVGREAAVDVVSSMPVAVRRAVPTRRSGMSAMPWPDLLQQNPPCSFTDNWAVDEVVAGD